MIYLCRNYVHIKNRLYIICMVYKDPSGLENWEYGRRDPSRWPRDFIYLQKLTQTSPTSSGRSVGIVRSRTQAMKFVYTRVLRTQDNVC
jgi:hypothetical protein